MRLIATRNFLNNLEATSLRDNISLNDEGLKHPKMIHKGHEFEIGHADKFDNLRVNERQLVAKLAAAHCIGDASDPETVKRVRDEIAQEEKEAKQAKRKEQT